MKYGRPSNRNAGQRNRGHRHMILEELEQRILYNVLKWTGGANDGDLDNKNNFFDLTANAAAAAAPGAGDDVRFVAAGGGVAYPVDGNGRPKLQLTQGEE